MRRCTNQGFSLVETMIAVAVFSIAIVATGWVFMNMAQNNNKQSFAFSLTQVRTQFQNLISNDRAWNQTMQNNPASMYCLFSQTSCLNASTQAPQAISIYDQNGHIDYDLQTGMGFTANGTNCNYGQDPACVIRLNMTWLPKCDTTSVTDPTCLAPYVVIQGTFSYQGNAPHGVNMNNYNFTLGRAIASTANMVAGSCPAPPAPSGCSTPGYYWVCMGPHLSRTTGLWVNAPSWECHYLAP